MGIDSRKEPDRRVARALRVGQPFMRPSSLPSRERRLAPQRERVRGISEVFPYTPHPAQLR